MIKFLPSYVGSKAYWVEQLQPYKGSDIVELFAGSAVISANLAGTAVLNDRDEFIYKIFSNYEDLIVPEIFTEADYYRCRSQEDWWKYAYCLQKMSFSGVFRHSKNGYNVPMKKGYIDSVSIQGDYNEAKERYRELKPTVLNLSYDAVPTDLLRDRVVVLDPPYEKKQASYNGKFDYNNYWVFVRSLPTIAKTVIVFDTNDNIRNNLKGIANVMGLKTRKMRVNGKHDGDSESMCILGENKCQA